MNEYKDAMDSLCPTDEQKERMFLKAEIMAEKESPKKRRNKIKMTVIAVAAMTALLGTTTAFADDIKQLYHKFFSNDTVISDDIIENIYEDRTEHLVFTVERIVSDRISSYAIIKYTALDDWGKEWLDEWFIPYDVWNMPWDDETNKIHIEAYEKLNIKPDKLNVSAMVGVNCKELTDESDENSRTFRIGTRSYDDTSDSNCIRIVYQMSDGATRSARLDVSESVPLIERKIDSENESDASCVPLGIKYSKLGITIYGNAYTDDTGSESYENSLKTRIIMKDGSELNYSGSGTCTVDPEVFGYNSVLFTTYFNEPVEVENLAGVWFNGVYYELN